MAGALTVGAYVTTVAGTGAYANAASSVATSAATFRGPRSTAIDATGNVYVADTGNNCIRKITPAGTVSIVAGSGTTSSGYVNATGTTARFKGPRGVAVSATGDLYVADTGNNCIRKITPAGVVTTFAGSLSTKKNWGSTNGIGTAARFNGPSAVALGAAGTLYVADTNNNEIRAISPAAVVSTYVGVTSAGFVDGAATVARFRTPQGVAVGTSGVLYVADTGNNRVRRIDVARNVTTYAGSGTAGRTNAVGTAASFSSPEGICVTADGNVYVADTANHEVRRIATSRAVSMLAGSSSGLAGSLDGIGTSAQFSSPRGLCRDSLGNLVLADSGNNKIRRLVLTTVAMVTPTAGTGGSITPAAAQEVAIGSDSTTITIAASTGYHIANVVVDGVSKGAISAYKFRNVTADHTISATFALDTFRITPSAGAGGSLVPSTAQTVTYGSNATFTVSPAAHYHVADVLVDGASVGATSTVVFRSVKADHTVDARFAIDTNRVSASAGAGGSITPSGSVDVAYGGTVTFVSTPDAHHHIADVLVDGRSVGASASVSLKNVTAPHTVAASFALDRFTVAARAGAHGAVSPSTTQTVDYGGTATVAVAPDARYHIADVLVDGQSVGASSSVTFADLSANHSVVASFAIDTYTITPSSGVHGGITPSVTQVVDSGGNATFAIVPHANYHIADVLVDGHSVGASSSVTFTDVSADHTISASYQVDPGARFTLVPHAGPNGTISPDTTQTVDLGGRVAFAIAPAEHHHIADVLVDGASIGASSSVTFEPVDENHDVSASFAIDTFKIDTSAGAHGSIVGPTQPVAYGSAATFLIVADRHYRVSDVVVDGASIGASSSVTFDAVSSTHVLSATFEFDPTTLFEIVVTPTIHGTVSPKTGAAVPWHGTAQFTIAPAAGCSIADVLVDGRSIGASATVGFDDVSADHTITASFAVPVTRVAGTKRYSTAVASALRVFPKWRGVRDVVVASGDRSPSDALVAAGLAGAYNCPLLIVPSGSLDPSVRSAIGAMPAGVRVHAVGSRSAISDAVLTKIKGIAKVRSVERIAGTSTYDTAALVARKMKRVLGSKMPRVAIVANATNSADLLAASAVAYRKHYPLLLVGTTQVPATTRRALSDLRVSTRYLIGSPKVVSEGVRSGLSIAKANRICGTTAAGDAVAFASRSVAKGWLTRTRVGLVASVAEAPTSGACMARLAGPVLLVRSASVPTETSAWLRTNKARVFAAFVFGRSAVISDSVKAQVAALLM